MQTHFDPELSRLAFEDRLLEYIGEPALPLLDRVRLLSIYAERMDVFFQTRVGLLKRLVVEGDTKRSATLMPSDQLRLVTIESTRMMRRAYELADALIRDLAPHGVAILDWEALSQDDRSYLRKECGTRLRDLVHPDVVREGGAFPHVRNLRPTIVTQG